MLLQYLCYMLHKFHVMQYLFLYVTYMHTIVQPTYILIMILLYSIFHNHNH